MSQPNILVFLTDQQRWDTCGCYGQPLPVTPHLDQLASSGILFSQAFTCQPVCGPVRAAMQTGLYPTSLACHTNHRMLSPDADTIAKQLSAAGYRCGYIGKWHLASTGVRDGPDDFRTKPVPVARRGGYTDYWLASDALEHTSHGYGGHMFDINGERRSWDESTYRVDAQTDWVLAALDALNVDKPFFLFTSYLEPHHQNDRNRYEGPDGSKERWAGFEVPGDLAGTTTGDWKESYPDYLGCCNALDNALGLIIDKLKRLKLLEDTLIIFTSDHGSHFRTRNPEYKRSCHDACIHIPLVVRGPGFEGGLTNARLTSNLDLPGTILTAAGLKLSDELHGGALQDAVSGEWDRQAVYIQISESQCGRAIRTSDWTYSVRAAGGAQRGQESSSSEYHERHLYDNTADPYQRNNLINEPSLNQKKQELQQLLLAEMDKTEGFRARILPVES